MKTIKELEAEIKEHIKKREQQGEIYLDDVEDNFKLQTEMAKKEKMA